MLNLHGVKHCTPINRIEMSDWPAIEPHRLAVRQQQVANTSVAASSDSGTQGHRSVNQCPSGLLGAAGVDRVRPDQVVQFVKQEKVFGADLVEMPRVGRIRHSVERRLHVDRQPDHQRLTADRGSPQNLENVAGLTGRLFGDDELGNTHPLRRRRRPVTNHHVATQDRRSAPQINLEAGAGWQLNGICEQRHVLRVPMVGPALPDIRRALVGTTAIHTGDHPLDVIEGVGDSESSRHLDDLLHQAQDGTSRRTPKWIDDLQLLD